MKTTRPHKYCGSSSVLAILVLACAALNGNIFQRARRSFSFQGISIFLISTVGKVWTTQKPFPQPPSPPSSLCPLPSPAIQTLINSPAGQVIFSSSLIYLLASFPSSSPLPLSAFLLYLCWSWVLYFSVGVKL